MASGDVGAYLDVLGLLDRSGYADARLSGLCGIAGRIADHLARTTPAGSGGMITAFPDVSDG
jgi:hypothetical protein